MKKPIFIILASVFLLFLGSSTAMAAPYGIEVGDDVSFTTPGPTFGGALGLTTGGGEFDFSAQDDGFAWTSYCAELGEPVKKDKLYRVVGLSDRAIGGGGNDNFMTEPGYDLLSDASAWLFWTFTWNPIALGYTGTNQDQIDLQGVLWYLEDEVSDAAWTDPTTGRTATMQNWFNAATAAAGGGWTNNGRVAVVNLQYFDTVEQEWTVAQDQLIAVPIPSAILLLASGLLGLIGIRRFKGRG